MSNFGSNSFVIEGVNGVKIYNKIMESFDTCMKLGVGCVIGEVNGKVYTIEQNQSDCSHNVKYTFSVWSGYTDNTTQPLSQSWISPLVDVELKDGNLHITESFFDCGVLQHYIADVKLYKNTNVYFSVFRENDSYIFDVTNDSEGKYFKRCCYFDDSEIEDLVFPDDFNELPFNEQLAICESLKDNNVDFCYEVTKLIETEKFFC